eukprot:CAMPEP_0174345264 /NCGR_PEP_ID=MMETSP0811_2-20130205/728_1 /TAXON_ID=73025 ORGANISM="Eutreptiella gymnastica-like, Strain CCMP1594" /NCGR_SAMPLE_ID=MMETSP0811_2 /ASSEMBLY_ACC=CAM_ASM_000667 /LENGTH=75 /DNA_ID=CAMNT_0015468867 /DNA_START=319 /DNA_END=546 /DNA_ORIENTATION=-
MSACGSDSEPAAKVTKQCVPSAGADDALKKRRALGLVPQKQVGRYLRELGMPPLTMQEEGLTKGTSCPSHCLKNS